jgi:hypothetical protein
MVQISIHHLVKREWVFLVVLLYDAGNPMVICLFPPFESRKILRFLCKAKRKSSNSKVCFMLWVRLGFVLLYNSIARYYLFHKIE